AQALSAIDADSDVVVVTLELGANDLMTLIAPDQPCRTAPTGATCQAAIAAALVGFANNFPLILAQLTAALANDPGPERLLVATVYNPLSGLDAPAERLVDLLLLGSDQQVDCAGSTAQLGLNDLITCTAGQSGATVVDVYPLFAGKADQLTRIQQL